MSKEIKISKTQKAQNLKMATAIRKFLAKHSLWTPDITIYFNGIGWEATGNDSRVTDTNILENVQSPCEYANPKTVSMCFENDFYNVMDYGYHDGELEFIAMGGTIKKSVQDKFNELIDSFGYGYERGHAWSLSLFKKD